MLDNKANQISKFRTKDWVEINDDSHGVYSIDGEIRFQTSMLTSCLCDYSDAYVLGSGRITITGGPENATMQINEQTKEIMKYYLKIVHHLFNAQAK